MYVYHSQNTNAHNIKMSMHAGGDAFGGKRCLGSSHVISHQRRRGGFEGNISIQFFSGQNRRNAHKIDEMADEWIQFQNGKFLLVSVSFL